MTRPIYYKVLQGLTGYTEALALQQARAAARAATSQGEDLIYFLEHAPVYTGGRRMQQDGIELEATKASFAKLGAEYHHVQRGGQITFHGPGQLVAYPILHLREHMHAARHADNQNAAPLAGVRDYVTQLEKVMIDTCAHFGVHAGTTEDTGVWINGQNKIGAIGIQVSRGITMHGLALNCHVDLKWYRHIVACGLVGKGITTLSQETGRNVSVQEALPVMIKAFEAQCHRPLRQLL